MKRKPPYVFKKGDAMAKSDPMAVAAGREDDRMHARMLREASSNPHKCAGGCGYPVSYKGALCGECACEEDGE